MEDKAFLVKFKSPELATRTVIAASAEIQGDHLVLLDSKGVLAALFLLDMIESWTVLPLEGS